MLNTKFKNDFESTDWRLANLYHIVNKNGKRVLFSPNNIQKIINKSKSKRKIILKARQMGASTNELIKQLDYTLFNENVTCCILAHEQDAIEKLFRIPRRAYEYLNPEFDKTPLDKGGGSKYEMFFPEINSRIYCDLESRGDTISWLHVSERAFIKERDRVLATLESVPLNGIVTFESTANGLNDFYDLWMDSESNYEKIFFPWFFHEEYFIKNHNLKMSDLTKDELSLILKVKEKYQININLDQIAFRRFKQREQKEKFKQEYPEDESTCFLTSGNSPFNLEIIKSLYDNAKPPIEIIDGIKIFKKYDNEDFYILAADTAEGVNEDKSAAHVFSVTKREQVASYHGDLKPSELADKLVQMAEMYSKSYPPPKLAVERNNHGHAVILKLNEILNYANLYMTKKEDKKSKTEEQKIGWVTDSITRPIMIDTLIEGIENGTIILNDKETLSECLTVVNNNGKIEAIDGKHDDLFIAAAISVQLCIEESKFINYADLVKGIKT